MSASPWSLFANHLRVDPRRRQSDANNDRRLTPDEESLHQGRASLQSGVVLADDEEDEPRDKEERFEIRILSVARSAPRVGKRR